MKSASGRILVPVVCGLLAWGTAAGAGTRFLRANSDPGGNGAYINLIVREVKVTPIRAHVGDTIRIDMVIEDRGDLVSNTSTAEVKANGMVVASKRVSYGFGGEGERIQHVTLHWNTAGAKPGEYRIRGEFFVWDDASEFDNFLDAGEPLKIVLAGTAFPNGEKAGGVSVGRDPRYRPAGGSTEGNDAPSGGRNAY